MCRTPNKRSLSECLFVPSSLQVVRSCWRYTARKFYTSGSTAGIQKNHEKKLRLILANLDQAEISDDMDLPGLFMHQLKGDRKEIWSVRVSGNWRITYRFTGRDVEIVNYEDYH